MKKILFTLITIMALLLSSCNAGTELQTEGIENFHSISNICETDIYLMPSDDFITKFNYLEADYFYYSKLISTEKSFIYFKYDENEYTAAFEYTMEKMVFLDNYNFEAHGYTFCLQDVNARNQIMSPSNYPTWFWMMFYSEEKHIIGFFGYYNQLNLEEIPPYEDFSAFIKYEFPYYEW